MKTPPIPDDLRGSLTGTDPTDVGPKTCRAEYFGKNGALRQARLAYLTALRTVKDRTDITAFQGTQLRFNAQVEVEYASTLYAATAYFKSKASLAAPWWYFVVGWIGLGLLVVFSNITLIACFHGITASPGQCDVIAGIYEQLHRYHKASEWVLRGLHAKGRLVDNETLLLRLRQARLAHRLGHATAKSLTEQLEAHAGDNVVNPQVRVRILIWLIEHAIGRGDTVLAYGRHETARRLCDKYDMADQMQKLESLMRRCPC